MKTLRTILLFTVALLVVHVTKAAEAAAPKSYLDSITLSPYGAVTHHNITDGQSWGTGLDLGLGINKFVSVHALAAAYSDNNWRGSAVDELGIYGKARLVRNAGETLSLYGLAGGDRDFNSSDWALGVGLGVELRVHKNVSLFADSRIRAWFREGRTEDLQTRAGLNFSF